MRLFSKIKTGWMVFCCALLIHGLAYADPVRQIAEGLYLRPGIQEDFSKANQGHVANIGFVVGTESVAVIDTGSSLKEGQLLRESIRQVTDLPIRYVIITHMHPDHALGTAAFNQDKPLVLGHEQLQDALVRRQSIYLRRMSEILGEVAEGTGVVMPEQVVVRGEEVRLDLGGRTLTLRAYPTAHTNNDLTVYDDATHTLWLSDLLFIERIPVVDGSLLGWLKVLEGLPNAFCSGEKTQSPTDCQRIARVVPGHGPATEHWQTAIENEHRYLTTLANDLREIIRQGGSITQAVDSAAQSERNQWLLFDLYNGRNVTAGFAELEWE